MTYAQTQTVEFDVAFNEADALESNENENIWGRLIPISGTELVELDHSPTTLGRSSRNDVPLNAPGLFVPLLGFVLLIFRH